MARAARIALIALACLTVVSAGLYAYLRWNNYNALRDLIAERVQQATGQQLSFNGPVSLEMGADSFLNFRDVVLTNPDWQMFRSTITVDEGRIGLDVPNVVAGGIGTVVELKTVKVELDRPEGAGSVPIPPPPGTVLSAPSAPPLPKFDELHAQRLIVIARNMLGARQLELQDLKVAPETQERTRMEANAASADDIDVTVLTDEIEGGRAWTLSVESPRSDLKMVIEAASGRKLTLKATADASHLDVADLAALIPAGQGGLDAIDASPLFESGKSLPIGWLQLIKANLDVQLAHVTIGNAALEALRLEGRADNGWVSLAPFEASAAKGALRGFAVFNAASLPIEMDLSLTADAFTPFVNGPSQIDGALRLAGRSNDFSAVKRPDGEVAFFGKQVGLDALSAAPLMGRLLPYLAQDGWRDATASCAVIRSPVTDGRMQAVSGQLYSDLGRLALRGRAGVFEGPLDLEAAVQPAGLQVAYYNAVGSYAAPAIAQDTRKAPWLNFDLPQDKVCALLRQQFDMARNGR